MIHRVRCLAPYFDAVEHGEKNFEVRLNDRGYQRGDILVLIREDPEYPSASGRELYRRITWILQGGQFGIEPQYCVMALEDCAEEAFEMATEMAAPSHQDPPPDTTNFEPTEPRQPDDDEIPF
jgi:hypothetical protein